MRQEVRATVTETVTATATAISTTTTAAIKSATDARPDTAIKPRQVEPHGLWGRGLDYRCSLKWHTGHRGPFIAELFCGAARGLWCWPLE